MTCIIAISENNKIYMGGDGAASNEYGHLRITNEPKVFMKGPFIIGYTTSFRMGQILQYKLKIPKQNKNKEDFEFMATDFIDSVIACFEKNKFGTTPPGHETFPGGGCFIVGYKGKIYSIESNYQVNSFEDNFTAVGSGAELALGSLYTTKDMQLQPTRRIVLALEAATRYNAGVAMPYTIVVEDNN
jgi:ATP-dependent protease HslVU (ClpYQ) peptidase subunit